MSPLAFMVKVVWRLKFEVISLVLWVFYAALPDVFFRRLGRGTKFYGPVRFGSIGSPISIGKKCRVGKHVFLAASRNAEIVVGDRCSINTGCHIVSVSRIEIGDDTLIAEYVTIRDQNHTFHDPDRLIHDQGFDTQPVKIGRDVWIGRGAFVGRGITIGDGCVIGANSVVTRSLPAYSIAVGVPAKILRSRKQNVRMGAGQKTVQA